MLMLKVLIFGTGVNMQRMINSINYKETEIIACIDNNPYKIGQKVNNICIISPNSINQYKYDFIIIASIDYLNITNQLLELEVDSCKIIQFYNGYNFLPGTLFFNDFVVKNNKLDMLFLDTYCTKYFIDCK